MKKIWTVLLSFVILLCGFCSCTTFEKKEWAMQASLSYLKVWVSDGFTYNYGTVITGREVALEKTFDNETVQVRFVYEVPSTSIGYYNSPKLSITKAFEKVELEKKKNEGFTKLSFFWAFEKPNPYVETRNRLFSADMNVLKGLGNDYSAQTFAGKKTEDFMKSVDVYQGRLLNHWYKFTYQLTDLIAYYDLFTNYLPMMATRTINLDAGTVYLSDLVFSNE